MPVIPFGEWLPDLPDLGNPGATVAKNVLPYAAQYQKLPRLTAYTDALTAYARGLMYASDKAGALYNYAGDVNDLYTLTDDTWINASKTLTGTDIGATAATKTFDSGATDLSIFADGDTIIISGAGDNNGTYTVDGTPGAAALVVDQAISDEAAGDSITFTQQYQTGDGEVWRFALWNQQVFGVNLADYPQKIILGATSFVDLTTAVKARDIAIVREHVVVGNTWDSVDGFEPGRVRWSGLNAPASWAVSASTLADFQDIRGIGGGVQRIMGGEYGVVFMQRSIQRMSFVGAPIVFQFDEILRGRGCFAPNTVCRSGRNIFYLGLDGFEVVIDGSQTQPIGNAKVDRTFYKDVDEGNIARMSCAADPVNRLVWWAYPGQGSTGGLANKLLIFDWANNRWASAEVDTELLFQGTTSGYSLDGLDSVSTSIDALTESLDSRTWVGGAAVLGAFDASHKAGWFSGAAMDATLETGELELNPGQRSLVKGLRPIVDGGTPTVQVGSRNRQQDAETFGDVAAVDSHGRATLRKNARYHRVRVNVTGEFDNALGVEVEAPPAGTR